MIQHETSQMLMEQWPETKNSFKYKLPGEQEAEFQVTFYSDFIIIKYTKGDFEGQFGHNASIEGIYLKQKK